jgi:hypothetical protein
MVKIIPFVLFVALFISCSSTRQATPLLKNDNLTYVNKESHVALTLPRIKGWNAGIPAEGLARNIVYGAVHVGKIMNLVLSVEPLNGDLEDYYILVKRANDFEKRSGFKNMALDSFILNGQKALRFVYQADVITVDSTLLIEEEDSLAAEDGSDTLSPYVFTPYVYTNIFMKYNEFDYWLEISTLGEGYERRKQFIEEVVKGLQVIK